MKKVMLNLKNKTYESRGAITVEASLTFTVMLLLFLLLFMFLRFACINIAVNHAVNETAKQIAAAGYPVTFLNEIEDELISESGYVIPDFESEKSQYSTFENSSDQAVSVLSNFIAGEFETQDLESVLKNSVLKICNDYKQQAASYITQQVAGVYYKFKTDLKYTVIGNLLKKHCNNSGANYKKIKIIMAELPQSNAEYEMKLKDSSYLSTCSAIDYTPQQNDVIIAVEYSTKANIPFFGNKTIVTRHIAVEKAWINGNNAFANLMDAVVSSIKGDDGTGDGEDDDNADPSENIDDRIVYVTKYGVKYHEDGCRHLHSSKIAIGLSKAKNLGYTACKHCH